jgi:maleylacetoacetate isomerase
VSDLELYDYWRSSAAYRVRIALNLKQLAYTSHPVHLVRNGGEQRAASYLKLNPQGLIPVLIDGERVIRQSIAIIEYLDETRDGAMKLLPSSPEARARVRGLAGIIACDTHPPNNLRIMRYLERELGTDEAQRLAWTQHWMQEGFRAFEGLVANGESTGIFCEGDTPTLADCCLVPQLYNARRFKVDLSPFPTLVRIDAACAELEAFKKARPEMQPDAE